MIALLAIDCNPHDGEKHLVFGLQFCYNCSIKKCQPRRVTVRWPSGC